MTKVRILTFGCKVNQYESELMAELLEKEGFLVVPDGIEADVYIVNTCAVTKEAERKFKQTLRRIRREHKSSEIIVTGCYVQLKPEEAKKLEVDMILGIREKKNISKYIHLLNGKRIVRISDINEEKVLTERVRGSIEERTRAYIKVEDGCDRSCTYCAIRLARGTKVRSKPPELVVEEVEELIKRGYREIVITGVNVGRYGIDIGENLVNLLRKLLKLEGDYRIRLSSMNVEDVSDDLIDLFQSEKLCPHLHLSLQSGSDRILRLMGRRYTTEQYLRTVEKLRKIDPLFSITTDIIVGFPGESDEDFEETLAIVKKVLFTRVHAFRFSARDGTPASRMVGQIPGNVKKERLEKLLELAKVTSREYKRKGIGMVRRVLVEKSIGGISSGYDEYYVHHEFFGGKAGEFRKVLVKYVEDEGIVSKCVDMV